MIFQTLQNIDPDDYFMKVFEIREGSRYLIDVGNDFNATKSFLFDLERLYPSHIFEMVFSLPKQGHK